MQILDKMNIFIILFFLLNMLSISSSKMVVFKNDLHHSIRNTILKFIIFKEKKMHKLCDMVRNALKTYENKTIVTVADSYFIYNDLSEEDKIIIETILSLCY
jgi:hypothetical protein